MLRCIFTLVLILILTIPKVNSQTRFNKIDHFQCTGVTWVQVIESAGKYYCFGMGVDSAYLNGPAQVEMLFASYDSNGKILRTGTYHVSNQSLFITDAYKTIDNGFILAATYPKDQSTDTHILILGLDSLLNVQSQHLYNNPVCSGDPNYELVHLTPTANGDWLMLSEMFCSSVSQLVLTKLDAGFNILWNKRYQDGYHDYIGGKVLAESDGYLLINTKNNNRRVDSGMQSVAEIIKTDTAGTVLWKWAGDTTHQMIAVSALIRSSDGGYIYCGAGDGKEHDYYDPYGFPHGEMSWKPWIVKLDSNRNIAWTTNLDCQFYSIEQNDVSSLLELEDRTIVATAHMEIAEQNTPDNKNDDAFFIRLNKDGQQIWMKRYTYQSKNELAYELTNVIRSKDSSFVLIGSASGAGWILKTDSLGITDTTVDSVSCDTCTIPCDTCNTPCDTCNGNSQNDYDQVSVYPNPATNYFTVKADDQEILILRNIMGSVVFSMQIQKGENKINFPSRVPSGIYFVQLVDNNTKQTIRNIRLVHN